MSCCNELDARLTVMVCLTGSFAQSLLGVMFAPFPYLLLPCLGIFLSWYFVLGSRQATADTVGYYLWFFMAQQVGSIWWLWYYVTTTNDVTGIGLNAFFLFTGSVGVVASYRLGEHLRSAQVFSPVLVSV